MLGEQTHMPASIKNPYQMFEARHTSSSVKTSINLLEAKTHMPSSVKIIHQFFEAKQHMPSSVKIIHQMLEAMTHMPSTVTNHPSNEMV
jgi:hypothetical protein